MQTKTNTTALEAEQTKKSCCCGTSPTNQEGDALEQDIKLLDQDVPSNLDDQPAEKKPGGCCGGH